MYLLTKDEIEARCTEAREDPGLLAAPYDPGKAYEAKAGTPAGDGTTPPAPLEVAETLKDVFDPEIPVNIYDLGLIYDINVSPSGDTSVLMTLTAPNCPAADILPGEVAETVAALSGVGRVGVELTFEVPWVPDMMSEIAKVSLGIY